MVYNPNDYSPTYGGVIDSSGNVKNVADTIDSSGNVKVSVSGGLGTSAVKLEDGTTTTKATIDSTYGLGVDVKRMPTTTVTGSVGITGTPSVSVTSMPTTTVTGNVGITGTPSVNATISGTPNVAVTSMPTTTVTGSVGITGTPAVTATGAIANNADGVATSSTNIGTAAYNYGWNGSGWDRLRLDSADNLITTNSKANVYKFTMLNAVTATGASASFDATGYGRFTVIATGTFSGTITIQYSLDNSTWASLYGTAFPNPNGIANTLSAAGAIYFNLPVPVYVRVNVTSYTSGSITVNGSLSNEPAVYQQNTTAGSVKMQINDASGLNAASIASPADALSIGGSVTAASALMAFNGGTTFDRVRSVSAGDGLGTGLLAQGQYVYDSSTTVWNRARSANSTTDGTSGQNLPSTALVGFTGTFYDRVRVAKVYKYASGTTVSGTAGSVALWTPSTGKKARIMGVNITVSAVATRIDIQESGTGTVVFGSFGSATTNRTTTIDFGNGQLSTTANNIIYAINNGSAADIFVSIWGTEE